MTIIIEITVSVYIQNQFEGVVTIDASLKL